MVLAQRDTKSDGKIICLKQLFRKCLVNQRNSILEHPSVNTELNTVRQNLVNTE